MKAKRFSIKTFPPNAPVKNARAPRVLWWVGLGVLCLLAYWPMFANRFVWSDPSFIVKSEAIRSLWPPSRFFTPQGKVTEGAIYPLTGQRPGMVLSFALDYSLWKLNPWGYHLTNFALHLLCVFGVVILARKTSRNKWAGYLAGALFAVHPGHAEAVIAFLGRSDLLATVFVLTGFLMYWRHREAKGWGKATWYAGSLGSYLAACFSKETGLVLLGALIVFEGLDLRSRDSKTKITKYKILSLLPFLMVALIYWAYRGKVLGGQAAGTEWWGGSPSKNFMMMLEAYAHYLRLLFFPRSLSPLHTVPAPKGLLDGGALWGAGLLAATVGIVFWALRRHPRTGFLGAWFLLGLVPVANIIPIPGVILAERWLYLPSVGACALGGWGAWALYRRAGGWTRWAWAGLMVLALGLWGARTWVWTRAWRDEEGIARTIIATSPNSYLGQNNLGNVLIEQGRFEEAVQAFREAIRLKPNFARTYVQLGNALGAQEKLGEAEQAFRQGIALRPDLPEPHNNLGNLLGSQGRSVEAEGEYREALRLDPGYAEAHNNLGNMLGFQGKTGEAEGEYREAIRLQPDYLGAHFNLALTLEERGKFPEAEAEYRLLLRRSPGLTRAYYQLGFNLFRQNRREEAAEALEAFLDHGGEGRAEVEAIIRRLREP